MDVDPSPSDSFLRRPEASTSKAKAITRVESSFNPLLDTLSKPFIITKEAGKNYDRQYANLYFMRLNKLRKRVVARAKNRWSKLKADDGQAPTCVDRVLEVETGTLCYIIGTVYMDMPLKPDILEEIAREHNIIVPPPRDKFFSAQDTISLEDASGRITLIGERIRSKEFRFVTGVIAAVLGMETPDGCFEVVDVCFAGLAPQQPRKVEPDQPENWIAITSGLDLGGNDQADDFHVDLLAEFLTGELAGSNNPIQSSNISQLIIAGNSMRQQAKKVDDKEKDPANKKARKYGYDSSLYSARPTQAMNTFLSTILPSIDVLLLPGGRDPAIPTMPQQPLHPALLPEANKYNGKGLFCATNPCWVDSAGLQILATSGQTIDDIFKYLEDEDRLGMARETLGWSHMAPTAPDTLLCYPFSNNDPFILTAAPHVYIIGNQPEFATDLVEDDEGNQVRVVMVPRFSDSQQIVLVNAQTLDVQLVSFSNGDSSGGVA